MNRTMALVNRIGLGSLGLLLFAAGGLGLALGAGALGAATAARPVMPAGAVGGYAARNGWLWPVTAIVSLLIAVGALAWLVSRLRVDRVGRMRLEGGVTGVTEMSRGPICAAIADQVGRYPGVERAKATLRGSPHDPLLDLRVTLHEVSTAGVVLLLLREEMLRDARSALGVQRLRSVVRLGFAEHGKARERPARRARHRRDRALD